MSEVDRHTYSYLYADGLEVIKRANDNPIAIIYIEENDGHDFMRHGSIKHQVIKISHDADFDNTIILLKSFISDKRILNCVTELERTKDRIVKKIIQ